MTRPTRAQRAAIRRRLRPTLQALLPYPDLVVAIYELLTGDEQPAKDRAAVRRPTRRRQPAP